MQINRVPHVGIQEHWNYQFGVQSGKRGQHLDKSSLEILEFTQEGSKDRRKVGKDKPNNKVKES